METTPVIQNTTDSAQRPSIVENFSIDGLFGYRSISFSSQFAATVLIARNGSGKTTLIASLDAFLRGQFTRFAGLKFKKITCILRGHAPLILTREEVDQLTDLASSGEVALRAQAWEVEPLALLELLEAGIKDAKTSDLLDNPVFYSIYAKLAYDIRVARLQCERLEAFIADKISTLNLLRESIKSIVGAIEIVYLPTYRRIELSLPNPGARNGERRKSIFSRLGVTRSGLYAADIQFGLGDISDRLRSLNSEMLYQSNQGYGKVSANVINDLISGGYRQLGLGIREIPLKESLEIFFSRIKDAEREYRRVPYNNFFTAPDLDRVYRGDIPDDAKPFLNYFLDQLNSVIKETEASEELVEAFIASCNRYLSGEEESIDQFSDQRSSEYEKKKLTFNRRNLRVKVTSLAVGAEIPLESLSSGEKQMISLFARLYLYPGPKLILIDEPELSLSLDWQRQILPDVLRAPSCRQVIAITHSPFIFDNELEPFATSVKVRIPKQENKPLFDSTEFGDEVGEPNE